MAKQNEGIVIPIWYDVSSGANTAYQEAQKTLDRLNKIGENSSGVKIKFQIDNKALNSAIRGLQAKLQEMASERNPSSPTFKAAEKEALAYSKRIDEIIKKISSMPTGSVMDYNEKMKAVVEKWNSLSAKAKLSQRDHTKLSGKAKELVKEYIKLTKESKAFGASISDTAKRVEDTALLNKKSIKTVEEAQRKVVILQERMNTTEVGSAKWMELKTRLKAATDQLNQFKELSSVVEKTVTRIATGSIVDYNNRLQQIRRQWEEMPADIKFADSAQTRLSSDARELYKEYTRVTKEMSKSSVTLDQMAKRSKENALLRKKDINTVADAQKKVNILQERMNNTPVNTAKWKALQAELKIATAQLKRLQEESSIVEKQSTRTLENSVRGLMEANKQFRLTDSYIGRIILRMAALAGVGTFLTMLKNIREITAEFEIQRVSLSALLQDSAAANEMFERIKSKAVRSPFEVKDLVSYTKQLAAYRVEQDKLFDTTMKLADVSAGLGVDMNRIILAYGQVKAAAVLRGQELRQFTEAGIPLVQKLAEKFTELRGELVTTGEVFKLISERAVSFQMVSDIFDEMTEAGGEFYRMQELQAETLRGKWTNLKDAFSIMYDEIGRSEKVNSFMVTMADLGKNLATNWRTVASVLKSVLVAYGAIAINMKLNKSAVIGATMAAQKAAEAQTYLNNAIEVGSAEYNILSKSQQRYIRRQRRAAQATIEAAAATNMFSRALKTTKASMIGLMSSINPVLIAIEAAVVGLTWLLGNAARKTANLSEQMDALKRAAADVKNAIDAAAEDQKMLDMYKELSEAAILNHKDLKKLNDITETLSKTYPEATRVVGDETKSIELNTEAIQRNIDAIKNREDAKSAALKQSKQDLEKELEKTRQKLSRFQTVTRTDSRGDTVEELTRQGMYWYSSGKRAVKQFSRIVEQEKELTEALRQANEALLYEKIEKGEEDFAEAWKRQLKTFQKEIDGTKESVSAFSVDIIGNFANIEEAWKEAAENYKKFSESVESYGKALQQADISQEEKAEIEAKIKREQAYADVYYKVLEYYGQLGMIAEKNSAKTKRTEDGRLAQLKEEFKLVKSISADYNKFLDVFSEGEAKDRITELFDGVTKIDFLGEQELKDRFQSIYDKAKSLLTNVTDLTYDSSQVIMSDIDGVSQNLVNSMRQFEGFKKEAYKDSVGVTTIGIGHSAKAPSANEYPVVEGMVWTEEQVMAAYKADILATKKILDQTLVDFQDKYPDLIGTLSVSQYDALLDWTFQSGKGGLTKLISWAQGDIEKMAEGLGDESKFMGKTYTQKARQEWRKNMMNDIVGGLTKSERDAVSLWLQDLGKEIQEVSYDEILRVIQGKLKELSLEVSRTKEARSFWTDIFDSMGGKGVADAMTKAIFGTTGDDVQKALINQIATVFSKIGNSSYISAINESGNIDFLFLEKMVSQLPKEYQKEAENIVNAGKKAQEELYKSWAKELNKEKSVVEKRVDIVRKSEQRIAEIRKSNLDTQTKDTLIKEYESNRAKQLQTSSWQIFKESAMYVQLFSDLQGASDDALTVMRERLVAMQSSLNNLDPTDLKEIQSRLKDIDDLLVSKNPFGSLISTYKKLHDMRKAGRTPSSDLAAAVKAQDEYAKAIGNAERAAVSAQQLWQRVEEEEAKYNYIAAQLQVERGKGENADSKVIENLEAELTLQGEVVEEYRVIAKSADETANSTRQVAENAGKAADAAQEQSNAWTVLKGKIKDAAKELQQYSDAFNSLTDGINSLNDAMGVNGEETEQLFGYISDGLNGANDIVTGIAEGGIAGYAKAIGGAMKVVASAINLATFNKINAANKSIEEQTDIVDKLAEAYSKLESKMEEAFGADYETMLRNQRANIQAQINATNAMIEAERSKGKKSDEDKIEEYESQLDELNTKMTDMAAALSQKMMETDVTSAAKDFASAWLDAYLTFSDTTEAMQEKLNDMIKNMVVNSLLAAAFKKILQPVFDLIDKKQETDTWEDTIAKVTAMTGSLVSDMDAVGNAIMSSLGTTVKGLRSTSGSLTGISKDIASASEESILGLAAGINTQNFYISGIYTTVNQILAMLAGSDAMAVLSKSGYRDTGMVDESNYLSYIPTLTQHAADILAECKQISADNKAMLSQCADIVSTVKDSGQASQQIVTELQKVIKPAGVKATYHVKTSL